MQGFSYLLTLSLPGAIRILSIRSQEITGDSYPKQERMKSRYDQLEHPIDEPSPIVRATGMKEIEEDRIVDSEYTEMNADMLSTLLSTNRQRQQKQEHACEG